MSILFSLNKGHDDYNIEQTRISFAQQCFVPSLVELPQWFIHCVIIIGSGEEDENVKSF